MKVKKKSNRQPAITSATAEQLQAQLSALSSARPYQALAQRIAALVTSGQEAAGVAGTERKSAWAMAKEAISIARDNEHTADQLRGGMHVALDAAKAPKGTRDAYSGLIAGLYADSLDGDISEVEIFGGKDAKGEEVSPITVAEARKRYEKPTELAQARQRLKEAMADWGVADINALAEVAEEMNKGQQDMGKAASAEDEHETARRHSGTNG